jgi:isoquinoline 1-oxidoreductase subunit alpha
MIEIIVNGARRTVESAPDTPLLWVLRDELGLTGTRFGCGARIVRTRHKRAGDAYE